MAFDLGFGPLFGALFWFSLIVVSDCDLLLRKVPNLLNAAIALVGCSAQLYVQGAAGLQTAGLGLAVGLGLVIVPFALRLYRGGDAKLVMALGVWLGAEATLWMFLLGMVLGGLLAAASLLVRRRASKALTSKGAFAESVALHQKTQTVPMAVAFSLGAAVSALRFL